MYQFLTYQGEVGGLTLVSDNKWAVYCKDSYENTSWRLAPTERRFGAPEDILNQIPNDLRYAVTTVFEVGSTIQPGTLQKSCLRPSEYYPRIWRGRYKQSSILDYFTIEPEPRYGSTFVQSVVAAIGLFDSLQEIFRLVEPDCTNFCSYGHRFRELLVLACTEVETNLRSVYLDNFEEHGGDKHTTTRDYVLLLKPLALDLWKVRLEHYPALPDFSPFSKWSPDKPTQTLDWYNDYNAVKHDRENNFAKATFKNTLEAMAALHIILCAQWGPGIFDRFYGNYPSPYITVGCPSWQPGKYYLPPLDIDGHSGKLKSVQYTTKPDGGLTIGVISCEPAR